MADMIRSLFSSRRSIDRTIEKVIDYYAQEENRLSAEISEYEITDNIENCFRRFLDVYGEAVSEGRVTQTGIWVSGFYGSGKFEFRTFRGQEIAYFARVCCEAARVLRTLAFERGRRNSSCTRFLQLHREDRLQKVRNSK